MIRCNYVPAKPYSLRLDQATIRGLAEEAARLRVPARTLAQKLVEEGLRMRRHPTIAFFDRAGGRTASLRRRPRLRVGNVIETVRVSPDLPEAADYLDLSLAELEQVLDYYAEFRDEVDEEIRQRQEFADREERLYRQREAMSAAPPR